MEVTMRAYYQNTTLGPRICIEHDDGTTQWPIIHLDGSIAYDNPDRVSEEIKKEVEKLFTETLLPCPNLFCEHREKPKLVLGNIPYVYCQDCMLSGPDGDNKTQAIILWNYLPRVKK